MTFHIFSPPPPATLISRQLAEAQRQLLEAQAALEYTSAIAQMLQRRIERLTAAARDLPSTQER